MSSKIKHYLALAMCLVVTAGIFAPLAQAHPRRGDDRALVVIEWNQLAQKYIAGPPFSQLRQYAILHVAIADAVVAIEGRYEPFRFAAFAPRGASSKAAAAQAAHDVLVSLLSANAAAVAAFDTKLAADLASIPPGPQATGVQVGKKIAAWVLAWRQNDGFATANPQPVPPALPVVLVSTLPGIWRTTPSGAAQYAKLGDVEPFGVLSTTQFLPDPPPQLESELYAKDLNEVETEGRRPLLLPATAAEFTIKHRTALLWAGGMATGPGVGAGIPLTVPTPFLNVTNSFRIWHNVARDVAQDEGLDLVKTARLFALLSASMHDSVQTAHTSKFVYRLWRPETAIAQAGVDDNAATIADGTFQPLLLTPPYPSHSSNMQCIGAGAAGMLKNVFRTDAMPFTATWYKDDPTPPTAPTVVHSQSYTSFSALSIEEGNSRVYGGIHFRFELNASIEACTNVANYIFDHKMQQDGFDRFN